VLLLLLLLLLLAAAAAAAAAAVVVAVAVVVLGVLLFPALWCLMCGTFTALLVMEGPHQYRGDLHGTWPLTGRGAPLGN
jgi:hypothetical protein